jgi:biotin transport system substrate-specific component
VAWRVLLAFAGSWLVAALAQIEIHLPFTPVPITGQTLGVLAGRRVARGRVGRRVDGAVPGCRAPSACRSSRAAARASSSCAVAVTGGYLWGFVLSAAVVGALAGRKWDRSIRSSIGEMFLGEVVLYAVAIPWLMQALDVSLGRALELGLAPFVVGDTLKLLAAAGLLPLAWRTLGRKT